MKIFSRDFTKTEKSLLLFLSIILLGLLYLLLVDRPVRNTILRAEQKKASIQTELDLVNLQLKQLGTMEEELGRLTESSGVSYMGSYNNSQEEVDFLNEVLSGARQYTLAFEDVTRDHDQIRRPFSLEFTAKNYSSARKIISDLEGGPLRCRLGDVTCSGETGDGASLLKGPVRVSAAGVFYETMVEGTPDTGLPEEAFSAAEVP